MTAERIPQAGGPAPLPPDFMLPDPPKVIDMRRGVVGGVMHDVLRIRFARREDVLVAGYGYLRLDALNESERFAPNLIVAFGVDPKAIIARNGYIISEVGKPPDFILEIATQFTATKDYALKREGYRRYGVKEYWRFDESGGLRNGAPLIGDALADGRYVQTPIIRDEDFRHWGYSAALKLYIGWDDGRPRFYDPLANEFQPDVIELARQTKLVALSRDIAVAERDMAMGRLEAAKGEREDAPEILAEKATELARLREKLSLMMVERLRTATRIGGS